MANAAPAISMGSVYRRVMDKCTGIMVTAGGLAVLMALLLIVLYLFWIVLPLFKSPQLSFVQTFPLDTDTRSSIWGVGAHDSIIYRVSDQGRLNVISLHLESQVLLDKALVDKPVSSLFFPVTQDGTFALGLSNGEVQLQKFIFSEDRQNLHNIDADLEIFATLPISDSPIEELSFGSNQDLLSLATIASGTLSITQWQNGEVEYRQNIAIGEQSKIQLTPDGKTLYLLTQNQLSVYRIEYQKVWLREKLNLATVISQQAKSMALLPNGMLLLDLDNGETTLWFDVVKMSKRHLMLQHRFVAPSETTAIEPQRNIFASVNKNKLHLWHFPTKTRFQVNIPKFEGMVKKMTFSPTGENLLIEQSDRLLLYKMNNPHPEINLASLWKKIWYQGESESNYVWQSGADEMEIKVSLVPLLFGSIKVTVFSLMIAAPIALGGAIYTAYFMPIKLRKWVKPIVELMGAFPTVILGFLASLWLAPWLEYHLLTVLLFCIFAPLAFFLLALCWSRLPIKWQRFVTPLRHIVLLMLLIYVLALIASITADWLTLQYWNGDGQAFFTTVLSLSVEQKNALVVGLALSFAVIPTIFSIAEDAIFSVPQHLTDASLALGASSWQTLVYVVLTTASPGIFCAVMMGASRVIGETMIVLMATGNTPIMDWNPFVGLRSLAANIAVEMPESVLNSSHFRVLFLTAFLLFCFTFVFNTLAEFVRERLSDKYRAL